MLNPQAFSSTVWNVLSILQEQFGSMAGANMYVFKTVIVLEPLFGYCVLLLNVCFPLKKIPDSAWNTRLRSTLWRHWGICGSAWGEETLEGVQPEVRVTPACFSYVNNTEKIARHRWTRVLYIILHLTCVALDIRTMFKRDWNQEANCEAVFLTLF